MDSMFCFVSQCAAQCNRYTFKQHIILNSVRFLLTRMGDNLTKKRKQPKAEVDTTPVESEEPDRLKKKRGKKRHQEENVDNTLVEEEQQEEPKKKKKNKVARNVSFDSSVQDNEAILDSTLENSSTNRSHLSIEVENHFDKYDQPRVLNTGVIDPSLLSDAPLHELLPKIVNATAADLELAKSNGLAIQTGKFSKQETEILTRNWQNYLRDYHIPNHLLLFGYFKHNEQDEERKALKANYARFTKDTMLYNRLAKDLPKRTLFQVYSRARILFSDLKKAEDYTEEDKQKLCDLHRMYGEDYRQICEFHGFDPKSAREFIRNKFKTRTVPIKNGKWSEEEINKLKRNVKKVMLKQNLTSFEGIPWSQVASNMPRSDLQCRQRFFSTKVFRTFIPPEDNNSSFNKKFEMAKLVALLKKANFKDDVLIDWDWIKEKFDRAHFNFLQRSWRLAKMKVPDYAMKTLPQIVDYLYERKVVEKFGYNEGKMKAIQDFCDDG